MASMKYTLRDAGLSKPAEFSIFSDTVASLLVGRGVRTVAEAQDFLAPDYDLHTHDPFLMKDMEKAVERLYRAIKSNEYITIFTDYDADGIPGGVILSDALKKLGYNNFEVYIPHRHDEGFGLSKKAIDIFKAKNTTLLITIDCGIADIDEVSYATSLGMDVIVTDHHMPQVLEGSALQYLPPAYAILNPKITDCTYPEKMLCGSGVVFKYVQALYKKYGSEFGVKPGWEKWFLDMVGIATLSDMVPLTGENRVFATYGLKVLKKTARPGLSQLFLKLKVQREHLSEDDIGFTITPRINAASRMGEPLAAFNLLSTTDEVLAGVYADALEHVNNERKGTVASLVKEIRKVLSERDLGDKKAIVLGNPLWRPALLGLVANSLAEEYSRPTFLWGRDGEGIIKGSCRSGGNGSVLAIMQKTPGSFLAFGGHSASGGFEVSNESIHTLAESLEQAAEAIGGEVIPREGLVDAHITLDEVSWSLYKDIEKLAPFGTGNPKPLFLIKGAYIEAIKSFGKEKNHTEIAFLDTNNRRISAIQFFSAVTDLPSHAVAQSKVDIVAHLEKSTFKRYPELRLRIVTVL